MTALVCASNASPEADDLRSCTFAGEHWPICDGHQWRWNPDWAPLVDGAPRLIRSHRDCRGCLPRPANRGLLCWSCGEKLDAALDQAVDLISHVRSIERGPADITAVRSAPGSRVILPPSWIAGDQLYSDLAAIAVAYAAESGVAEPTWPDTATLNGFRPEATIEQIWNATADLVAYLTTHTEQIIVRQRAAVAAVRFVQHFQTVMAQFPFAEQEQPVRHVRCRVCQHYSLRFIPPLERLDPIVVKCSNCGNLWDKQLIEFDVQVLAQELEEAEAAKAVTELASIPHDEVLAADDDALIMLVTLRFESARLHLSIGAGGRRDIARALRRRARGKEDDLADVVTSAMQSERERRRLRSASAGRVTAESFAHDVEQSGGHWWWRGLVDAARGPVTMRNGREVPAADVAYELHVGPVHHDSRIRVGCGQKLCVRPEHLVDASERQTA